MICPKCGAANADGVEFCTRCHATLLFTCPHCNHTQPHSGKCDTCGQNLDLFWKTYLVKTQAEAADAEAQQMKTEAKAVQTAVTFPFSGPWGWTLFVTTQVFRRIAAWFASR